MYVQIKFLIFLLLIFFPLFEIWAQSKPQVIFLAEIEGEIKAGTLQYLKRAIREAERDRAEYLVIKLDTPGGLLKATKDIVDLLLKTEIKTIVFVHKEGGWAYSAGTFILLAADLAIVHPRASIGACQPHVGQEEQVGQEEKIDEKIIAGMASWIRSLAETQKRNPEIAEKFVRENLTLSGEKAKEMGIINETAKDLEELFLKLEISQPKITKIQLNAIEKFFDLLSHPYLVSLFLTLGGLGLIFAFRTGEFELTGILGLILLLIGLWGIGVITFNILGIIFLTLGVFLLLLEIFEPGFGIFGLLGIASIIFGVFTLEGEPFLSPQIFDAITMSVLGTIVAIGILFIIIGRKVVRALREKPKTGPEALIGLEAQVIKELNPIGQVILRNEIWQAESISGETISEGSRVKIIKIEGNTLFVEKLG